MSNEKPKKKSLLSLWLLVALCTAPVVASYVAYFVWPPSRQVNYGELITPQPLPDARLALADGTPFPWHRLKGKWVLAMADSGNCDLYCQRKLLYMRQVRLAQGKEMDRVERAWLITDDANPVPAVVAEYRGTWPIRARGSAFLNLFPVRGALADHIYVIDPHGNLMMRFPRDADPRKIVKDIARLLRISRIG
jgi:cytochrome oxidase Cu insertion factor (SCO1/SenC/PrrC family)